MFLCCADGIACAAKEAKGHSTPARSGSEASRATKDNTSGMLCGWGVRVCVEVVCVCVWGGGVCVWGWCVCVGGWCVCVGGWCVCVGGGGVCELFVAIFIITLQDYKEQMNTISIVHEGMIK